MRDSDRHLRDRRGKWHYVRRVPEHVRPILGRSRVEISLKTSSLETARIRRDAMEEADDRLWASLIAGAGPKAALARHEAERKRCLALGFAWRSFAEIVQDVPTADVLDRVEAFVGLPDGPEKRLRTQAVLGRSAPPDTTVTGALELYLREIAPDHLRAKSPRQRKMFEKVKRRAVSNFVALCGDKGMTEITREDALKVHGWWQDRVTGQAGAKASPNSGNRDIGCLRKLYADYFTHRGEEERPNPFRNLRFVERKRDMRKRPPFPTEWIRDRILRPEALAGLNLEARTIVLVLIETGCRPSELCNLPAERIHLEAEVPHIEIDFRDDRELKSESSIRKVPLVGVALAALRRCPGGFPRYHDKEASFSAAVRKHFRSRGLFPSEDHVIYSLRHSFEDRMKEAGLDADLRRMLMGHTIDRPDYGTGGSLAYRRDELMKIALPFPAELVA